ncbi:hypothetical protein SAMN05216559_4159 [Halomicrobium zhouii]|uniref:Halobacterial output domain-containing protein n=1 Tax=Halomicrobium zhouii TaxID=767519 RepID=A0A1I6MB21_9EURY|nr:HalOD1 output domain-containing protein [Halomicrobium zhouii]SFS12920.1 hypothetical protein SAMN05216559_4159 [Halomicrobium zhouii]
MSSNDGTPYMIRHESDLGDDEWISPEPADDVITDAVVATGAVDADDVDDLSTYVDVSALAAVLDGEDEQITFSVEDHEVVVASDGSIDVTVE